MLVLSHRIVLTTPLYSYYIPFFSLSQQKYSFDCWTILLFCPTIWHKDYRNRAASITSQSNVLILDRTNSSSCLKM
mgnify:CR=1 FL=1